MCIIVMKPAGKTIPNERLETMWRKNSDGAGFMYAEDGKLHIVKGLMTLERFKNALESVGQENKIVMHFRIRTQGAVKEEMTHPFWVNANLGMAHNGTIAKVSSETTNLRSDSAAFALMLSREYADPLVAIKNKFHRDMIEAYIGSQNKLVFMDNTGDTWILNESAGTWEDGVWYSNTNFRASYSYYGSSSYYQNYNSHGVTYNSTTPSSFIRDQKALDSGIDDEELENWLKEHAVSLEGNTVNSVNTNPPTPVTKTAELVKYVPPVRTNSVARNTDDGNVVVHGAPIIRKIMGTNGKMMEVKTYPSPRRTTVNPETQQTLFNEER